MKNASSYFLALSLFAITCSAAVVNSETDKAAQALGANVVSEVNFDEGGTSIKAAEQSDLKNVIAKAKESGAIEEVKVIAWADREYPPKGAKASKSDIELANKRAEKIKKYLKEDLKVSDVKTYNMAERPNAVQDLFNTTANQVKQTMETTGAAPTSPQDTGVFGLRSKTSEAVVLVYLKR